MKTSEAIYAFIMILFAGVCLFLIYKMDRCPPYQAINHNNYNERNNLYIKSESELITRK